MLFKKTLLTLATLTVIGYSGAALAQEPPHGPSKELSSSPESDRSAPPLDSPAPATSRVPDQEVGKAIERFRTTGEAAVLTQSETVVFPFGKSQPEVKCTPLRACDIELQAGEIVMGVALGDTERWVTSPLASGDLSRPTPHVIVKPQGYDLATNLVIATDRRTYHLSLISPSKTEIEKAETTYLRHVGFYYPQEVVELWANADQQRERLEKDAQTATLAEVSAVAVDRLNFKYTIKGDRKIPWLPQTVFDDGEHVYIQLPSAVSSSDLPALLVEVEGGGMGISNYRVRGSWYIVDGIFPRAELVVGVGRKRKKVEIVNRGLAGGGS